MIKKRSRPQPRVRDLSLEADDEPSGQASDEEDANLPVSELIELRKLRRSRQGIDVTKLNKGDVKKKKRKQAEEVQEEAYGLRPGVKNATPVNDEDDEDEEEKAARARRAVRTNNFTQQTNVLDVDKHMMEYIEENMKLRRGQQDAQKDDQPQDDLYRLSDKYKLEKKPAEEGSVTNSLSMLTAIPEVDLGMDARLKNIEETEKAKQEMSHVRKDRKKTNTNDEEHLAASRCDLVSPVYRPNLRMKSDADIIRDARLEAMGLPPEEEHHRPRSDRPQMATDEAVMERFKKRMRK
ncbi:hypothetical protein BV25DRAFT_1797810 [Artomyces pyxidatus]|uniref:Uncharacterized protein n=1 Tax=Artomyces pyxidatus TaxID=48021 RepID=A0ACB8TBB3_9AGAM|nr:hypothetical protein BV25DRAFT_1797810 [Artomyces pyxidatus]